MMRRILAAAALGIATIAAPTLATAADKTPATKPTTRASATSQPAQLDITSHDAIEAAVDKNVYFTATVEKAAWTRSGKTLQIHFKDAPPDFRGISYENYRKDLDKAFGGDAATNLEGKQVEVHGTLKRYTGSIDAWKGMTQVAITKAV